MNGVFKDSVLSVVDQAVNSLSSFLTAVIVARALLPEAFGVYSLFITGIYLLGGFQNALITGPTRILGVRPTGVDASGYFRAQVPLQLLLSTILIAGTAIGLLVFYPGEIFITLAFMLCLLLGQFQELARVINLTRMTMAKLLKLDIVTHVLRVSMLLLTSSLDMLSAGTALLIIAVSCGIGLVVFGRSAYPAAPTAPIKETAKANWRYGRWLLPETIVFSASTQIYVYLTALWVSTTAVGGLSAVLVLMNAVSVLLLGVMNYAIPEARRRLIEIGYDSWRKWLWRIGLLLAATAAIFGVGASMLAKPLLTLIYSPAYEAFAYLFPILAIQLFLAACNTVLLAAFRTAGMPQIGFTAQAVSALVSLVLAYPLLNGFGVTGAAVGLLITQAIWTIGFAFYIVRGTLQKGFVTSAKESEISG